MRPLTYDEHKAAEAAFRGLPLDPTWTASAQAIYRGLTNAKTRCGHDKISGIGNLTRIS
jgi:hypothetical protein